MHGIYETSPAATATRSSDVHGIRLGEATTPFFSLCESRHAADSTLPRHRHPQPYACIVMAGAFQESGDARCEEAGAGTILLHPADDAHGDRFGPEGAICVNVSPSAAWLDATRGDDLFRSYRVLRGCVALSLGNAIRRRLADRDTAGRLALESAALALLSEAAHCDAPRQGGEWVRRVCDDIRSAPCAEWTLAGVAATARVHPMHVARTFRRCVGSSLGEFVRAERLAWARAELSASDAPLSAIATDAGFYDESHFCRAFRKHFGATPGSYRRDGTRRSSRT
jgi:AraC family transcriptional regulator